MTTSITINVARLLLIVTPLFLWSSQVGAQTTTEYTIHVSENFRTKENLALATDGITNRGRHLIEGGFSLVLDRANAEGYIQSIFEAVNIPIISVNGIKKENNTNVKAGGNDCESAQLLCSNTSQSANSSGAGVQELSATNQGCLYTEHQSSWYYLNVQTGGSLSMIIDPANNSDDYDFAIWGPFTPATAGANCPPVSAPIRCSYSAESDQTGLTSSYTYTYACGFLWLSTCIGTQTVSDVSESASGDSWVMPLTVSANEIYILLVDNFSNSGNPYSMSFGGTAVLGCTPVVLPIELAAFSAEKTTMGNLLNWTTLTENRSDYFSLEWTNNPNSNNWIEISTVNAAKNSSTPLDYSFIHSNPSNSDPNYYRLTLYDNNGEKTVYDEHILVVNNKIEALEIIHIYNLIGQEVNQDYHGLVIYQYKDGSTKKVLQ